MVHMARVGYNSLAKRIAAVSCGSIRQMRQRLAAFQRTAHMQTCSSPSRSWMDDWLRLMRQNTLPKMSALHVKGTASALELPINTADGHRSRAE
eukprot:349801-Chlamydomonas_euryale.AAC.23